MLLDCSVIVFTRVCSRTSVVLFSIGTTNVLVSCKIFIVLNGSAMVINLPADSCVLNAVTDIVPLKSALPSADVVNCAVLTSPYPRSNVAFASDEVENALAIVFVVSNVALANATTEPTAVKDPVPPLILRAALVCVKLAVGVVSPSAVKFPSTAVVNDADGVATADLILVEVACVVKLLLNDAKPNALYPPLAFIIVLITNRTPPCSQASPYHSSQVLSMNSLSLKLSQVMSIGSPKKISPAICVCVSMAGKFNKPALNVTLPFCEVVDVIAEVVLDVNVALPCCVEVNAAEVDPAPDLILVGETEMPKLDVIVPEAKSNFCAAADTLKLAVRVAPVKSFVPSAETVNDDVSSNPSKK